MKKEIVMKIFDSKNCNFNPRADMFLPDWINTLGVVLDAAASVALGVSVTIGVYSIIIFSLLLGSLGIAAYLCWKNQKINIIDENTFEYTTFLGKKTVYKFSDIRELRVNTDSCTLFVGEGKVHIESCARMSIELWDKIDVALKLNQLVSSF